MGHGVSTHAIDTGSLFVDEDLIRGCGKLLENQSYRSSFVSYIKSGVWVDSLRRWIPSSARTITHEERIAFEKDCILCVYKLPKNKSRFFDEILTYDSAKFSIKRINSKSSITSARTCSSNSWGSPGFQHKLQSFEECYAHMEDCVNLEPSELLSLMFNIIYVQYKLSSEYSYFIKYGKDKRDGDENSSILSALSYSADDKLIQTKHSKAAQDILLSCAAFFDESDLLTALEMPNWVDCFPNSIHDASIGITIIDTSLECNPIVYANQAFLRRAGIPSDSQVLGQNWAFLNGPKTEDDQVALIDYAIEHRQPIKAAITQYSRNGKPFINLLALRPVGKYCIGAHFHATKGCDFETLKSVDNLLTLMSYAIKQPPCSALESPVLSPRYDEVLVEGTVGGANTTLVATPQNISTRNSSISSSNDNIKSSYLSTMTSQLYWKNSFTTQISKITNAVVTLYTQPGKDNNNKDNNNTSYKYIDSTTTTLSTPMRMHVDDGIQERFMFTSVHQQQYQQQKRLSIRLGGMEGVPDMELLDF